MRAPRRFFATSLACGLWACGPLTEDAPATATTACVPGAKAAPENIDRFKELLIVDERVTDNAAAKNGPGGALSFRHAVERIASDWPERDAVTLAWFETWAPREVSCAWLRATAANGCDATCTDCRTRRIDLAQSPFRLMAIANRVDLADARGAGEGRLLFAVTDGPGDEPARAALPISVIVEFRLDGDRQRWASRFHDLGRHPDFDAAYLQALTAVTDGFVGSAHLAQVRVQDASTPNLPVMREFRPTAGRSGLEPTGLRRTPAHALDGSAELHAFVTENRQAILDDRYELPPEMLASTVSVGTAWKLPGVDAPVRRAFAANTCDGCHGQENPTTDGTFHISPRLRGESKVSRFLHDPAHPEADELTRRARVLAQAVCAASE